MTRLRLVRRNVASRPARSALLFAFATLTLFLFVFLRSILTTLDDVVRASPPDRLTVQSGVGLFAELPVGYEPAIRDVDGVVQVVKTTWFGGVFRDPSNAFPSLATDLEAFLDYFTELEVPPDQRRVLLEDRMGCLVGRRLAERFGLRVGDPMPILGTIYPLPDGRAWEFVVRAIYGTRDSPLPETLHLFHWKTLDEVRRSIPTAAESTGTASLYFVRVGPGRSAAEVASAIDARWENGPQRTHTQPESARRAETLAMLGDMPDYLGLVGGTALVAMLLAVVNAMGLAARERGPQSAILQALGFPGREPARLVLLESLLVVGLGGATGIALAIVSVPAWRRLFGDTFPNYVVRADTAALGLAASVAIALVGSVGPALRLARVRPIEVLRQEG